MWAAVPLCSRVAGKATGAIAGPCYPCRARPYALGVGVAAPRTAARYAALQPRPHMGPLGGASGVLAGTQCAFVRVLAAVWLPHALATPLAL